MSTTLSLRNAKQELARNELLISYQIWRLLGLAGVGILVWLIEWINPDFFNFPYLQSTSIEKIMHFWPLLIYAGIMATLHAVGIDGSKHDEEIFFTGVVSSILAGVWEEVGFRCLFVCTAMWGIAAMNYFLSGITAFIITGLLVTIGVALLAMGKRNEPWTTKALRIATGSFCILFGLFAGWNVWRGVNPTYWFYDYGVVPVVNFVTFGAFSGIFYGDAPRLFVFGMVAANAGFRDGHKYQGPIGVLNAWIAGFIMMYATMTYGLWTAICIHAIYDLEFDIIQYIMAKR